MIRLCGACTALLAFAVTIFRGLAVDNPTNTILGRALWSLLTFFIIGLALGWISQTVIAEYSRQTREQQAQAQARAQAEAKAAAQAPAGAAGAGTTARQQDSERATEGAGLRAE